MNFKIVWKVIGFISLWGSIYSTLIYVTKLKYNKEILKSEMSDIATHVSVLILMIVLLTNH